MASRSRGKARPTGCGSGFIFPAYTLSLNTDSVQVGSALDTVIGSFAFTPAGATLLLLDGDGGKFQLVQNDGVYQLITGPTATTDDDGDLQNVQVRVSWAGRAQDFITPITITPLPGPYDGDFTGYNIVLNILDKTDAPVSGGSAYFFPSAYMPVGLTITSGGAGYAIGDGLGFNAGGSGGLAFYVLTVDGEGAITSVLATPTSNLSADLGANYTPGSWVTTGEGSGFAASVDSFEGTSILAMISYFLHAGWSYPDSSTAPITSAYQQFYDYSSEPDGETIPSAPDTAFIIGFTQNISLYGEGTLVVALHDVDNTLISAFASVIQQQPDDADTLFAVLDPTIPQRIFTT